MSAAAGSVFGVPLPPRPYPGLRPFASEEWPIFFGRERMIDEVVERLTAQRLVVVHGSSGCGKSSLVRAGVLPRIEQELARGGGRWAMATATPGDEPLAAVATALCGAAGGADDPAFVLEVRRLLNFGGDAAAALVDRVCRDDHPYVCLLVDQFEELFAHARRHGPQQARSLVGTLIGLQKLETQPRLFVILTMRSEFLGACAQYEAFAEAVNAVQYLLPRMEHADLVRAIREPATLYDGEIAANLADRLIADVRGREDELPLIQHGLMLLHRDCVPPGAAPWQLTLSQYLATPGLAASLSRHADEVMATVDGTGGGATRTTEDVFRALTDMNADGYGIRLPRRFGELVDVVGADRARVGAVVDAFRADGVSFMRPYGSEPIADTDYVDISHEALLRCWTRIEDPNDGWLAREFKNGLVWRSLLVQADSFARNPTNVLSAATAEERHQWLQRRTEAWSARYGGRWREVVALVEASMAARARQMQRELEERTREERARTQADKDRLEAEKAKLERLTLQSELAAAQEKSRRLRVVWVGLVVAMALAATAALAAWAARRESIRANKSAAAALVAQAAAEDAARVARERREAAERRAEQSEVTLESIDAELAKLQQAASAAPVDSALRQTITETGNSIAKGVSSLLSPRVYIQITDESQRDAAQALARRLAGARLGDATILVPGVEVKWYRGPSQLRCFAADECRQFGQPLLRVVNRELSGSPLQLSDMSQAFPSGSVRSLHFEIFFGPGAVALAERKASAY